MKTILVPIDFSQPSENALEYATHVASNVLANLILLHVVAIPVFNNEYEVLTYTIKDSLTTSADLLNKKCNKIIEDNISIKDVSYYAEIGDLQTIISDYVASRAVDFIIMGITGHSTIIGEKVIGSNALAVSHESKVPVMIIPRHYKYKKIYNMAYASHYDKHISEHNSLLQVQYISSLFSANLFVLHVIANNHLMDDADGAADLYVEKNLKSTEHKTFILTNTDTSFALLEFIKSHKVDIIVIEQKKHSFFHKLFYPNVSKEVVFNSPIPVLTIVT
jgi:nucleotide-binding universal stress UspA family protein